MAVNYLEQLVAEWYEYRGYFVRKNVWVGKRAKGGYDCELDVVAFHPETKHVVQIEPSMDASSWAIREKRFKKKFDAGRKHIPALFKGIKISKTIDQYALLVFASKQSRSEIGGGKILLINELITDILHGLSDVSISSAAVSEQFPILRTFQFVTDYKKAVVNALAD